MTGIFATDCASTDWGWLDPGCILGNVGSSVGSAVTNALLPVWIILAVAVVIILIIAFAPNIRHIVPVFL